VVLRTAQRQVILIIFVLIVVSSLSTISEFGQPGLESSGDFHLRRYDDPDD
jgi:hypothetical protein